MEQPEGLGKDQPLPGLKENRCREALRWFLFNGVNTAFKEWSLIVEALADGRQSVMIRKGGIAEGRDGFAFKHDAFFLFPTHFHEQPARTTFPEGTTLPPQPPPGVIRINAFARVEFTALVEDRESLQRLSPYHFWHPEVVEERFVYGEPHGVHLALLRVYQLEQTWEFPDAPRYGGCRSWLQLPQREALPAMTPVLDDATHAARMAEIKACCEFGSPPVR